ncbi:uncharacterized protein [Penaeus vannamei]|uniref:uncharacterized protein n=1 Tax=Penaeus vannamei TaxID=6689 RepID=UPI00387FAE1A
MYPVYACTRCCKLPLPSSSSFIPLFPLPRISPPPCPLRSARPPAPSRPFPLCPAPTAAPFSPQASSRSPNTKNNTQIRPLYNPVLYRPSPPLSPSPCPRAPNPKPLVRAPILVPQSPIPNPYSQS